MWTTLLFERWDDACLHVAVSAKASHPAFQEKMHFDLVLVLRIIK